MFKEGEHRTLKVERSTSNVEERRNHRGSSKVQHLAEVPAEVVFIECDGLQFQKRRRRFALPPQSI
jgi:hypothetical protein